MLSSRARKAWPRSGEALWRDHDRGLEAELGEREQARRPEEQRQRPCPHRARIVSEGHRSPNFYHSPM
jgi:hypothetical protein